jgi:hypothetical protein
MHWLARSLSDQGLHTEAAMLWSQDLSGRRRVLGDTHEQTARMLSRARLRTKTSSLVKRYGMVVWREV